MESFSHYDILDKHGNRVAEGHKASFCLEDSECNRGTMPKYNCQNWGQQGDLLIHNFVCRLRLYVPVNNFSVILGPLPVFNQF